MTKVIGRFFFKLTVNGNLLGEYSNDKSTSCVTEAANRVFSVKCPERVSRFDFEGSYESVWREIANTSVCSNLTISRKTGYNGIYTLEWTSPTGTAQFHGEGMLCDEILIGNYWSH